ncbi:hypothetical protein ACLB2K_013668 [Fragaria x ananassa]
MDSAQVPLVEIDLGDDILNYANILSGSSGHNENMFPNFGYPASGDDISYSQSPIQSQVGVHSESQTTKKAKRAKNFSSQEDIFLVSAWLNTSLDPIIGNDQKVERKRASGTTEQDRMLEAKQKFRKLLKRNFAYEHCWNLLKFHPKWNLELSRKKPKTIPATPSLDTPSTSLDTVDLADDDGQGNEAQGLVRPIRKKAAKTLAKNVKAKEKVRAAQSKLGNYYALKVEHARKEDEQFQLMYNAEQENIKLRK